MSKKKNAKERRNQARQARIDAANKKELEKQLQEYAKKESADAMPETTITEAAQESIPETAPEEPVSEAITASETKKKQSKRPFRPNILKPSEPMEREDGRAICPVPLSIRMTLEDIMNTIRKEDQDGEGRVFIRTDGTECLGSAPHMTYWYERGLYIRADQLGGKNRSIYVLADMLSRTVKNVLLEQKKYDNTSDWYITLSPAAAE